MQDRYAGDVGDFLKYGLLRWLTMATNNEPALSLGVVWYRTPDESHNEDGKHTSYLEPGHPAHDPLRRLDPDLHDRLRNVLSTERSVAEVERSGALPTGTCTYSRPLTFADGSSQDRSTRIEAWRRWLEGAVAAVDECDVVFADPDNGIRRADHQTSRRPDRSEKHAYVDELAQLAGNGRAIVVYHHADRSAPVPEQAQRRLQDLGTSVQEPIAAVRASRGTTRLFLVAGAGRVENRLRERMAELELSDWADELSVVWYDPDAPSVDQKPPAGRTAQFSTECLRLTREVAEIWDEMPTIAEGKRNRIVSVSEEGVFVHTDKSVATGDGPRLIPAWMIEVAWAHLRTEGALSQRHLLSNDGLGVKRSAFVIALLSRFPGVRIVSRRPVELGFSVIKAPDWAPQR